MQVLKQNGNLLMLDEPTNDADVDLLRALENAIMQWPGTVLCISHDRYFLDRSVQQNILTIDAQWLFGSHGIQYSVVES
jgi:ATPase subunit of ABC transporter with duplicated ATPase domains